MAACAVALAGCKPTMPSCEPDPLGGHEPARPGFMVVPQVRAEAWNLIEPEWSPVLVVTELYFGAPAAGATVGYANFDGESGLVVGTSILRFHEGLRFVDGGESGWRGSLVLPDLNAHMMFVFAPGDPVLFASITTDLLGLRFAHCLGEDACFETTLRGPTIGPGMGFVAPDRIRPGDQLLGALILGGAFDAGVRF